MKKLLLSACFVSCSYFAFSQSAFTPGNLLVVRVGDGTSTLSAAGSPVFLDEYKRDGTLIQSIPMPTTADGSNARFVISGTGSTEGFGSLSPDRKYLVIAGYDVAVGTGSLSTANPPGPYPRVTAIISNDEVTGLPHINTSTSVTVSSGNARGAATNNGTDIWFGGGSGGIYYTTNGNTTYSNISSVPGNFRYMAVFNGQLYVATTSSGYRMCQIGTGLPTSSATITNLPGIPTSTITPNGFVMFDTNNDEIPDLLYFADDAVGSLVKYYFNGSTWTAAGSASQTGVTDGLKGLTGAMIGGHPTLYATSSASNATSPSNIIEFVDQAGTTETINATITPLVQQTGSTKMFRNISFTPGTTDESLPVKLTSFTGKQQNKTVKLSWATASEQNNSHFDVLRSASREDFKSIGQVTGHGTTSSPVNYSFIDEHPLSGTSYYQLNQVDFDGRSEKSPVVAVKTDLNQPVFTASLTDNDQLDLQIYATNKTLAHVIVSDISGRKLADTRLNLEQGYTKSSISLSGIQPGIYVASVAIGKQVQSLKFTK
ncbi:T9SS type A sorting domain-containing protein [Pedobacter sp. BS3]|uniref:T9SS type A sorting domain-containing protein n=1 Tax=Pedobacter sp. BS3 TaxID=2567937 RepID=UPI0011EF2199|nr:T9SS type A sorting domain-containing protein [Pedobacter sp. BS3]TZF82784.1 T9SS type A sorting domain-containing protein [Pedobacter sp. BS3]